MLALSAAMISIFLVQQTKSGIGAIATLLASIFLLFIMVYSIIIYRKNAPVIRVDNSSITFGKEIFLFVEIKNVVYTGKMPFKYFVNFPMEGAEITFKNDKKKYIYDELYTNSSEIKSILQQVVSGEKKNVYFQNTPVSKEELQFETLETFKGNPFINFRVISMWILLLFMAYAACMSKNKTASICLLCFFGIPWFFITSWMMHYFQLGQKFFVIKNHNFPWKTKIYPLENIKEVIFETADKRPNCLRIITHDYKNKLFLAATLRDKTWLQMKTQLEAKGIKVRNECIH
ncbi:MAG: hypothetical protein NT150_02210 [Bacteroidetes bacterium]|nr:hypothetical protein [Bacteroidota bacterium]